MLIGGYFQVDVVTDLPRPDSLGQRGQHIGAERNRAAKNIVDDDRLRGTYVFTCDNARALKECVVGNFHQPRSVRAEQGDMRRAADGAIDLRTMEPSIRICAVLLVDAAVRRGDSLARTRNPDLFWIYRGSRCARAPE